ncbi:hypothetical protein [Acidovorax kalamii]|nr:hypothetical protein [Acidovorax kalamii]
MEIDNTRAIALASYTLLGKLIAVMKRDALINDQQIATAVQSARRVLEEDGDPTGVQAGLFLEGLQEGLLGS